MKSPLKVEWRKTSHAYIIDGYVGQVCCFQIHREAKTRLVLICELPHVADGMYGRLVVNCKTPQEAAQRAQATLDSWTKRFHHA